MVWTEKGARKATRSRRLQGIECLETRTLLSVVDHPAALIAPAPAGSPGLPAGATDFDSIIGASAARAAYKVDGTGMTVALIDTGVNYNHEDLGGGYGPGHKVIAGFDFSTGTADPFAQTWQHGTAVAGLAAGSDPADPGVAPGADIVALRVFGNDNTGSFDRVADALQWVVDHHSQYNISVVNLSLSDGNNYTQNWFASDGGVGQRITTLVDTLDQLNIPVVTATGNAFTGFQGVGFTSIIPETISVTATDSTDHLTSTAQRLGPSEGKDSATDLAAPGAGMYAPLDGNSFGTVDGTSFAAPLVSGSIMLLQQLYEQRFGTLPTVDNLDNWLKAGADTIHDSVTGIDIGRLDIPRAAALVPMPAPVAPPPPVVTPPPVVLPPVVAPPVVAPPTVTTPPTTVTPPVVTPPVVTPPQVFFNGKALSPAQASQAASGWASFFSLFTGSVNLVRGWGKSGAVAAPTSTPSGLDGVTFTKIQGWSNAPKTSSPTPAGTILPTIVHPRHTGFAARGRHH